MSKETILKEFDNLTNYLNSDYGVEDYRNLFIKAIDQTKKETREETISEIEKSLPPETFDNTYNYALKEVKDILNKLKK